MAIDLIENSELGALSSSRLGDKNFIDAPKILPIKGQDSYNNFLGSSGKGLAALSPVLQIGVAVQNKQIGKSADGLRGYKVADATFKNALASHYNRLKERKGEWNDAIANLDMPNGVEAAFQVVRDFGAPRKLDDFSKYNQQVNAYRTYFISDSQKQALDCETLFRLKEQISADMTSLNEQQSTGANPSLIGGASQALSKRKALVEKLISQGDCVAKMEKALSEASTKQTLEQLQAATSATATASSKTNYLLYAAYGIGGILVITALVTLFKKN